MAGGLMATAVAEIGLISYRSVRTHARGPLPSELLAVVGIWGGLSLFSGVLPEAMTAIGVGLVVATALPLFSALDPLGGAGFGLTPNDRATETEAKNKPVGNLPPAVKSK